MELKEVRIKAGMTRPQFAQYFGIPYRTVQSWELYGSNDGGRKCPEYLLDLIYYQLVHEGKIKE